MVSGGQAHDTRNTDDLDPCISQALAIHRRGIRTWTIDFVDRETLTLRVLRRVNSSPVVFSTFNLSSVILTTTVSL